MVSLQHLSSVVSCRGKKCRALFLGQLLLLDRNLITKIHMNFNIVAFEDSKETKFVFEVVLKTNHAVMEVFKNRATHISVTLTFI